MKQLLGLLLLIASCEAAQPTFIYSLHSCGNTQGKEYVFQDLFDCKAPVGRVKVAYLSAMYEDWRPDSKDFPKEALGKPLDNWPGERIADTNNPKVREIIKKRIKLAKDKGYQAVDIDNVDRAKDVVALMKDLSSYAHSLGLKIGQKNAAEYDAKLKPLVDFQVIEECAKYKECNRYTHPIQFHIEYRAVDKELCKKFPTIMFADLALKELKFCP